MIASRRRYGQLALAGLMSAALTGRSRATAPVAPAWPARLTLPVMINGTGPYDFVIDTGSDRTVLSRELAAALKLPPGPIVSLHDAISVGDVETVIVDRLAFHGYEVIGVRAPILAVAGLGAPGILGNDSLRDLHLVMDFDAKTVQVGPSRKDRDRFDPSAIIITGKRRFGQLILVDAESHGEPIYVILDSGAEGTVGNSTLRSLVAAEHARQKQLLPTQIMSVTGRHADAEFDDMSEIRLGGIIIRHVPIAFANLQIFRFLGLANSPAMLLGMDVLQHFERVAVDVPRGEALFLPRSSAGVGLSYSGGP